MAENKRRRTRVLSTTKKITSKAPVLRTKKLRSAVELEHSRLTSLINSMADAVIAVDENIKVALFNGAALNILDTNKDFEGQALSDIFHPVREDGSTVDVNDFVKGATVPTTNRDLLLKYADGSSINLYISVAPVHLGYGAGGDRGFVLLLRDITHEKSLEEERDEFISVVSHELRTPIAITEGEISNAKFINQKTQDTSKIQKALEEAHHQVLFLADMINDLSTLSRAERGILELNSEAFSVKELLEELKDNYDKDATDAGLKLVVQRVPANLKLNSSPLYVREILQNFITNAIKYTEKGSVTLSAKAAEHGAVTFSVQDTGIGLSRGDQKKVFDKFYRVESYRTRTTKGTGLGLYVTRKLINLLGAKLEVESKLDHGSTFSVTIPPIKN